MKIISKPENLLNYFVGWVRKEDKPLIVNTVKVKAITEEGFFQCKTNILPKKWAFRPDYVMYRFEKDLNPRRLSKKFKIEQGEPIKIDEKIFKNKTCR